jgi:GNAT superfamily N-acetyltransferase
LGKIIGAGLNGLKLLKTNGATPVSDPTAYRQLTLADVEPAARVIAQAFVEDPLCRYMLPFRFTRVRTLVKFFRAYGQVAIAHGRGYGCGEPLQGVAYWNTPDDESISVKVTEIGVFIPLLFTLYPLGLYRAQAIMAAINTLHKKYASGPHYYLDNLGVLSEARGQGVSSRLIRPFLARADERGLPAYTDTVNQVNVPLYEHFGFQAIEEVSVPGTGITVWALFRAARS